MTDLKKATQQALEKVADALPAYIDGVAAREYLAVIHKALKQQQAEPVQEPVQHEYEVTANDDGTFSVELPDGEELRIIPPRREWRSLSGAEIANCWHDTPWNADLKTRVFAFFHTIEAALKEKNHD
jgi:hypothetical protein